MRFLMTTTTDPNVPAAPPSPEMFAAMDSLIEEMTKAGVMLASGGLDSNAIHITKQGGKVEVLDGPFTEAKEAVVGFALIECNSREEAVEYSKKAFDIGGDGTCKIQQVYG